jgi:predicted nucleic acid-binding protein
VTLTYLDSGVLIAATRNIELSGPAAVAILNDPDRTFSSSEFVRLEILPKAVYYRRTDELELYHAYFAAALRWATPVEDVIVRAIEEAERYGLAGMDALHVASALLTNAEELITTERPTAPIHRVAGLRIVSIHRTALTSR